MNILFILLVLVFSSHSKIAGFGMEDMGSVTRPGVETLFVFLNSARSFDKINQHYQTVIQQLDKLENLKYKIAMTNIDDDADVHNSQKMAEGFGIDMDLAPHVVFVDQVMDKFLFNQTLNIQNIQKFIKDALDGKIKQFVKSEPIPKKQKGPLQNVVALNLHQKIWHAPEQVLLYLYTPVCSRCPQFQQQVLFPVIQRTKSSPKLKFFQINTNANELLNMPNIGNVPCILFFHNPKDGLPELYEGSMKSIEEIVQWMKSHSKFGISDPIGENRDNQL